MTRTHLSRMAARSLGLAAGILLGLSVATTNPAEAEPRVVASIKPVHSLVAAVMGSVGVPHLIVRGGGSPHSYALKPSDARALSDAQVIFWVGPNLETFLGGPLKTIGARAKIIELGKAHGLVRLPYREGGPWDEHAHDHDDDHKHGEAKHDHDDDHKHGEAKHDHKHGEAKHDHDDDHKHGEAKHDHDGDHAGEHGTTDMHLWLDPRNAKAMVEEIAEALVAIDPANKKVYEANAQKIDARLAALEAELGSRLKPVADRPFIVFHDAYQYLEKRFALNAVGSVTVSPEVQPGAKRLKEMRGKIAELGAVCVFAEPQFTPKLVSVVVEGTRAKTGVLDPLGAALTDGPGLYFELMRGNAKALADCLAQGS